MISFIGACNVDIIAVAKNKLVPFDSNVGKVTFASGGVMRNVCHNYSLVKPKTSYFFTCLGKDNYAKVIYDELKDITNLDHIILSKEYNTSTFLAVMDNDNDLNIAINDMEILKYLNANYLSEHLSILNNSSLVVLDSNLDPSTYEYLFNNVTADIACEAVSGVKVVKLKPYLSKIKILKANLLELEALTFKIKTKEDFFKALDSLNIPEVYITLGSNGAISYKDKKLTYYKEEFREVKSTLGLGDAFFSGVIYAKEEGLEALETLKVATAFSKITSEVVSATNPNLSLERLKEVTENVY